MLSSQSLFFELPVRGFRATHGEIDFLKLATLQGMAAKRREIKLCQQFTQQISNLVGYQVQTTVGNHTLNW